MITEKTSISSILIPMITLTLLCSCAKVVSHPEAYQRMGRPAWTFDENRIAEDLIEKEPLFVELKNPDDYYFFLGIQTQLVETEENARLGAYLDAANNFKVFLELGGKAEFEDNRGKGLVGNWNKRKLKSNSIGETDVLSRQLKAVRWYLEEVQSEFLGIPCPIRWRAWCISAISRERCNELYAKTPTTFPDETGVMTKKPASAPIKEELALEPVPLGVRSWTISNGPVVEAEFVDLKNYMAILRRKDGRVIRINSRKLSGEDLSYMIQMTNLTPERIPFSEKPYPTKELVRFAE